MPLTPDHSIYYPDSQMNVTPLESHFAAMATSVDNAIPRLDSGTDVIPVGGNWNQINFREGAFTAPPVVVVTVNDDAGAAQGMTLRAHGSVLSTSFRVHAKMPTGDAGPETVRISWIAIQQ